MLLAGKLSKLIAYTKELEASVSKITILEREVIGLRVKIDEIDDAANSFQDWTGTHLGDCLEAARTFLQKSVVTESE